MDLCRINVLIRIRVKIVVVDADDEIKHGVENDTGIVGPFTDSLKQGWSEFVRELIAMCPKVLGEGIHSCLNSKIPISYLDEEGHGRGTIVGQLGTCEQYDLFEDVLLAVLGNDVSVLQVDGVRAGSENPVVATASTSIKHLNIDDIINDILMTLLVCKVTILLMIVSNERGQVRELGGVDLYIFIFIFVDQVGLWKRIPLPILELII